MATDIDYLSLDDKALLAQCEQHTYRSSGPGGQHRNKVSSAVRVHHKPTGISAHGDDSRSQHENRHLAIQRLRMNIACQLRHEMDPAGVTIPTVVAACIFVPRGGPSKGLKRLEIGRKDQRFWTVGAFLLDLLDAACGQLSIPAGVLGVSSSNFVKVLQSDRHLLAAAQDIRKRHGQKPIM